jgi:5-methylcytosine-specific restriction endonuclease McrA
VISVRQAPERRLDPTSLQSLCYSCHSRKTAAQNSP